MLTGVLIVLLLLTSLLAIPITLIFSASSSGKTNNVFRLRWAFGLVNVNLAPSGKRTKQPAEKTATEAPAKTRGSRTNWDVLAGLRQKPFRNRILKFAQDAWRAIVKENLILRLRLGLGDPADTGQLWAVVGPVSGVVAGLSEHAVSIEPEFAEAAFEAEGSGKVSLIPLRLISLSLMLLLSPSVWKGIRQMRREGR